MVPAFGFSVGDFIQLVDLCTRISKALRNTAFVASSEFQHVMLELGALQKILSQLAALTPNEHNIHHVNAIRGMALACQVPLQEFLVKIEHYENPLGLWARTSLNVAAKKAKWAVFVAEDMMSRKRHNQLMMSIEIHRSKIDSLSKESREMRDDIIHSQRSTNRKISELKGDIESKLEKVSENTTRLARSYNSMNLLLSSSRASFFYLRVLPAQVLNFLRTFPAEIRALLEKILRANMQMYATLVRIQTQLASSPRFPGTENIVFEDGLGVVRELPYGWFKHWETFSGLLQVEFKDTPGRNKIMRGEYYLTSSRWPSTAIQPENWQVSIYPGVRITMHILMINEVYGYVCPRPGCGQILRFRPDKLTSTNCEWCGSNCTIFAPANSHPRKRLVENALSKVLEIQVKVEEELKLLGFWEIFSAYLDKVDWTPRCFATRIEAEAECSTRFCRHTLSEHSSDGLEIFPETFPLITQLSHLLSQPGHFPGLVALFRTVDTFWNMAYLRKEEGKEIEFYRNLGVHSTGKSHNDLLLATDGLALRLGFAVFREKALSSAHLDKPVSLIDWLHRIWNGEEKLAVNDVGESKNTNEQRFSETK
ncbi:hypothetical protein HYFRA_00004475 [Hymenoscyphus fraxineus]|uniref:Ubiquitin-like domain-containing protein n=1 Tax=Hymenoscyphus fraxineus TaxID=746836 RepID=A0A9N9KXD3_9HELO|nr:hypothetical protein HYFRA_00004475 [Hymenoscyphus fraxineus]